ncbi:MAG: cysteine desulfurase [Armatimonadetes bacterium]|nr:cysteine desulfurase [Armatimonadota bacterium]
MGIYLDHAATTPVLPEAAQMLAEASLRGFGNPSSIHIRGQMAREAMDEARQVTAKALGCLADEIVFTSGGTEANSLALIGACLARQDSGRHLVISAVEHESVRNTAHFLETLGFRVTEIPVDPAGLVDPGDIARALTPETILISVMTVNNIIGTVQPVTEISELARKRKILFHTDAVQAFPNMLVEPGSLGVDLLSLSSHKFRGPKGMGVLYVRKGTPLVPLVRGGHQENGLRAGTENLPGIMALALAIKRSRENLEKAETELRRLRNLLAEDILANLDHVKLNGHSERAAPHIAHFSVDFTDGESLVRNMDHEGVIVSAGSACSSEEGKTSHVLEAIGQSGPLARGTVRFSLSRETTEQEVRDASAVFRNVVVRLRSASAAGRFA